MQTGIDFIEQQLIEISKDDTDDKGRQCKDVRIRDTLMTQENHWDPHEDKHLKEVAAEKAQDFVVDVVDHGDHDHDDDEKQRDRYIEIFIRKDDFANQ